jgi:uncharacterized protein
MDVSFSFAGETLLPLPCGALHWPARATLMVADLHFEKASSFARRGRLLPPYDSIDTLAALIAALERTRATSVICLGDSFHDAGGPGRLPAPARAALRTLTASLDWLWITGNHDDDAAAALGGRVMAEARMGPLTLRHQAVPGATEPELSGHFHPKLTIQIRGRRIVRRCFALAQSKLVLPAFGAMTGGLCIADPAFTVAIGARREALVAEAGRLLRFPVTAPAVAA